MPVVPAPPEEEMPRIEIALVPEVSIDDTGREAHHFSEIADALLVEHVLGHRGDADRHLADAFLAPRRRHDDFFEPTARGVRRLPTYWLHPPAAAAALPRARPGPRQKNNAFARTRPEHSTSSEWPASRPQR